MNPQIYYLIAGALGIGAVCVAAMKLIISDALSKFYERLEGTFADKADTERRVGRLEGAVFPPPPAPPPHHRRHNIHLIDRAEGA